MPRHNPNVSVFDYMDYREYLKDWYADAKANRRGFSFRAFSIEAGFNSPNFYKLVMDGDRNLTEKSIVPFMKGLRLNKQEQEFFHNLVYFGQAKTHDKKNFYYQRMVRSRKFSQIKHVERSQYEFYADWYHQVIRELTTCKDFEGTPEWIAARLSPEITVPQARKSLELLEELGLIKKVGPNRWEQEDALITTGPEIKSSVIVRYHQNLLELMRDQLTEIPAVRRDISAMTLGVTEDQIPILKEKIRNFRKEIIKFLSDNATSDQVLMLNIQLLPATKMSE